MVSLWSHHPQSILLQKPDIFITRMLLIGLRELSKYQNKT